jgi:hypothetical protein
LSEHGACRRRRGTLSHLNSRVNFQNVALHQAFLICLILAPAFIWGIRLRPEVAHTGFENNDFVSHAGFVDLIKNEWNGHSIGLEAWDNHCCFGAPTFRTYQNFGHFASALVATLLNIDGWNTVHLITYIVLITQGFFFFLTARAFGFSKAVGVGAAWLAPLISSNITLGQDFYSYVGLGAYAQLMALPSFLCLLISAAKLTAWSTTPVTKPKLASLTTGALLALTFLLHHFFGYMALFCIGTLSVFSVLGSRVNLKEMTSRVMIALGSFVLLSSYQLLSILQDKALVFSDTTFDSSRWKGVGIKACLITIFSGKLLDFDRLPIFSGLAAVGLALCMIQRKKFKNSGIFVPVFLFLIGFFFVSGRETFGSLVDLFPGISKIHLVRFVSLMHIGSVFLAAFALGTSFDFLFQQWKMQRDLFLRLVFLISGFGLLSLPAYLLIERWDFLESFHESWSTEERASLQWDQNVLRSIRPNLKRGNFWSMRPDSQWLPRVGTVPLYSVAMALGYSQFSDIVSPMLYPAYLPELFGPKRMDHYRFFNIQGVVLPEGALVPDFLTKVYESKSESVTSFSTPAKGPWDVVRVSSIELVTSPEQFAERVSAFLADPKREVGLEYPSIIPENILHGLPGSVPTPSLKSSTHTEPGWIEKGDALVGGSAHAVLHASEIGAFGIFRTAYHPRWIVSVNGVRVPPLWLGPGLLGFKLNQGINQVQIEFPPDPLRSFLFLFCIVGLFSVFFVSSVSAFRDRAS